MPRCFCSFCDDAPLLQLVHLDHGREQLEVVAGVAGELLQREDVLREAAAAEADAGAQEVRAEPAVEADPSRDALDVGADELADVRDLVDEADPRRRKAFEASLIISAEATSVRTIGASSPS